MNIIHILRHVSEHNWLDTKLNYSIQFNSFAWWISNIEIYHIFRTELAIMIFFFQFLFEFRHNFTTENSLVGCCFFPLILLIVNVQNKVTFLHWIPSANAIFRIFINLLFIFPWKLPTQILIAYSAEYIRIVGHLPFYFALVYKSFVILRYNALSLLGLAIALKGTFFHPLVFDTKYNKWIRNHF